MKIVLCSTDKAGDAASLERHIRDIAPEESLYTYRRIRDFGERLKDPRQTTDIAVLVATDEQELNEFTSLRDEFDNVRILLVLPAENSKMVLEGHGLRPRLLTFSDTGPEVVGSVLEKMISKVKSEANKSSMPVLEQF